jgi:disease resistance protein RPM1
LVHGLKYKKMYFVVLDDLWSIDAWNWINDIAFTKNNNRGSRILVKTRDAGLAERCPSEPLIYHLEPLQIDDAVHLLLRKTSKGQVRETSENMNNIVTKLVKKCGCLPLAILIVGGILATKKIAEWGKFYEELPSELESNPSLEAMRRIVTLSYDHLPSHLKPCFLYLKASSPRILKFEGGAW